jgi:hypothetical protein
MQVAGHYPDIPPFEKQTREYVRVDLLFAIVPITVEISGFERRRKTLPESLARIGRVKKALEANDIQSAAQDAPIYRLLPLK